MTPQFLRSEAARFREMAESTDREASRQRLLSMAADYESRATAADQMQPPAPVSEPEAAAEPEAVADETTEAEPAGPGKSRTRLRLSRTKSLAPASSKASC